MISPPGLDPVRASHRGAAGGRVPRQRHEAGAQLLLTGTCVGGGGETGERGTWLSSSRDAGSRSGGTWRASGAQAAPGTGCLLRLQLQFGKGWQSQLPEGEQDLLKRCRAAAAGSSGLDWQHTAVSCAGGPVEGWLLPEPSAGAEPGSTGPRVRGPQENPNFWVAKGWKRSHLLLVLCGEISCAPAAGQRRLIGAQQRMLQTPGSG